MRHIIFPVFLSLILIGFLAQCAVAPRQSEPVPSTLEPALPSPEPGPPPPEVATKPAIGLVASPPLVPQPHPLIHEVRWPGETLSHIARWYTGSESNWKKIVEANPRLEPRRIRIGDKILIPEALLKIRRTMPREYAHSLTPTKKPPSTTSLRYSRDPRKEELFGPVEVLSPASSSEKTELYGPVELDQMPAHSQSTSTGR